jgi:hypothetical protein
VYTEQERKVPAPYIKHSLDDLGIGGPKQSWWYKIQLFNPEHHAGPLLYFDLDTVIVNNIDWICQLPPTTFWAIHDFKYLWNPLHNGINSSVMWWNTNKYSYVWDAFKHQDLTQLRLKYSGDQDFISETIPENCRRFFDKKSMQSWRWQCFDGGYDFSRRLHKNPGTGTRTGADTSVLIFHGKIKPAKINDSLIVQHWQ